MGGADLVSREQPNQTAIQSQLRHRYSVAPEVGHGHVIQPRIPISVCA